MGLVKKEVKTEESKKMPRVDITEQYKRERQFNPSKCRPGTFRTKKVSNNVSLILCKKKGQSEQSVQSILKRR